jgi:hypothetical protein
MSVVVRAKQTTEIPLVLQRALKNSARQSSMLNKLMLKTRLYNAVGETVDAQPWRLATTDLMPTPL